MERTIAEHIVCTPGTCGGKPRIAGHRIRVQDIVVWHEMQGQSPEEIVSDFPQLSLGDVHAALAYYHDHREVIRRQMREGEEFAERMRAQSPPGLLARLTKKSADVRAASS